MASTEPHQPFRIRSLAISVYLPTLLFAVGQGAVIPIIPLLARDLGASVALAGIIVALRGAGTMFFDVPAGTLVTRFGDRGAMLIGTVALAVVALAAAFSPSVWIYAVLVFVMGCSWSIWLLARLSYATDVSPLEHRGRVLALVGGFNRIGNFGGPVIGGLLARYLGLEAAFYMQAVMAMAAAGVLFAFVNEPRRAEPHQEGSAYRRVGGIIRDHRAVFATAGVVTIAIQVLRSSRQAVIPLWGEQIGLDAGDVGIIFGMSSAIDMTLFYPVGIVMDRFGRKWSAVPCLLVMSAGMLLIPLTGSFATLLFAGLVTGLGNGFGSGINMTLGSDLSPPTGRGEFLGVWRLIGDLGTVGGPAVVGGISAIGTLGVASVATGGIGLVGAAIMVFLVREPRKRAATPEAGSGPP
ncbi:MAG: MFS transporter [Dehalococcoidia bacterium]|nr:MFS transporter [Dehalococcoidia bacterium]